MQKPLISIIVPIYNVAPYLKECLQSLVGQSYEALDIVLIDDGSDDESLDIALDFAARDGRIFVVSKPNGGLSSARNFGLEFIKGTGLREFFEGSVNLKANSKENLQKNSQIQTLAQTHTFEKTYKSISSEEIHSHFTKIAPNFIKSDLVHINDFITQELPPNALIHFVDSDDYLTKDCIAKCVKALCEQGLDIVVFDWQEFLQKENLFRKNELWRLKISKNAFESGLDFLLDKVLNDTPYMFAFAPQGVFRAQVLNRYALRFSEGIYCEDHDFGTLLFALANRVACINEPLYVYRRRQDSTTGLLGDEASKIPEKLPTFLEPLHAHFDDYKALKGYFMRYCNLLMAAQIQKFADTANGGGELRLTKSQKTYLERSASYYKKDYFEKKSYEINTFYTSIINENPHIKKWLRAWLMGVRIRNFYQSIRGYWRHPKKFLRIFGLKKDKGKFIN